MLAVVSHRVALGDLWAIEALGSTGLHRSLLLPKDAHVVWIHALPIDDHQDLFTKLKEGMDTAFRLFITALPNDEFPLGLLQMCTKVSQGYGAPR